MVMRFFYIIIHLLMTPIHLITTPQTCPHRRQRHLPHQTICPEGPSNPHRLTGISRERKQVPPGRLDAIVPNLCALTGEEADAEGGGSIENDAVEVVVGADLEGLFVSVHSYISEVLEDEFYEGVGLVESKLHCQCRRWW